MSWQALLDAAEAIRATAVAADRSLLEVPLAGIGWATVDAERAQRELDEILGLGSRPPGASSWREQTGAASWREQPRDAALGARVWLRRASGPGERPWLAVLEPDTEGRLAASLARRDEGVAVIYLGTGPYRAGRLKGGVSAWGPHVVVLDGTGGDQVA